MDFVETTNRYRPNDCVQIDWLFIFSIEATFGLPAHEIFALIE